MLDIESLKTWAGYKTRSSESYSGIGAKGGSKAWEETYKKIMTSKESISFYLVAAQEHLDAVIAKQFAIETGLENLRKEQDILEIIEPLSSESNDIYMKIINSLGLEAKEGFGDKVKAAGRRVWAAIKEAFRKLRLAIVNIIAAIRRWFHQLGQGDSQKIYEKKNEIMSKLSKVGNKTLKVMWPAKKVNFLKEPYKFINGIGQLTSTLFTNINSEVNKRANIKMVGNKNDVNWEKGRMISKGEYGSQSNVLTRYGSGYEKSMGETINKVFGSGGKGWVKDKGGIIKMALYGTGKNAGAKNVKIADILKDNAIDLLSNKVAIEMKNASNVLDSMVKRINETISVIEKMENNLGGDVDKSIRRQNLEQLSYLRSVVTKVSIMGKDAYTEFFKLRGVVLKAAKAVLNGGGETEKEYQANQKKAGKNDKNISL